MGLRDLAKRAIRRAVSGGAAPSSPPPPRTETPAAREPDTHPSVVSAPPPPDRETDRADRPWFMQNEEDLEGWDETNPGAEPGKKNLRP